MCALLLKTRPKPFTAADSNKKAHPRLSEKTNVDPTYMCKFLMKLFLPVGENVSVYL